MPAPKRRPPDVPEPAPTADAEGRDAYPTYRDGPVPPHSVTASKPTDVELPRRRRTNAIPMLLGLAAFALILIAAVLWGSAQVANDAATLPPPAATSPASPDAAESPTSVGADAPAVGADVEGPGTIEPTPGAIDVPSGATTENPAPQPQ